MKRFITISLLAVGLLTASFIPATASADATSEQFKEFSQVEKYLGERFSIDMLGYLGKAEVLRHAAWDQSMCADTAFKLRPAGSGYTKAQADALADQEHGSTAHEECFRAVKRGLRGLKVNFEPFGHTNEYLRAKRHGKCTPKYCFMKMEGRGPNGEHKWRTVKVRRGQRVMVWSVKKVVKVKGKWKAIGKPFGIGIGGCTNKLAQTFERVITLKFKLRFSYGKTGKPKPKGNTPGPGEGHSLPPAQPPLTPPVNGTTPGDTTPPATPGGGGQSGNGGCTNSWGEPIPCA